MTKPNPKILIISSANPCKGPGILGSDAYKAFSEIGCNVDLLTLEQIDDHPEYMFIKGKNTLFVKAYLYIRSHILDNYYRIRAKINKCKFNPLDNYWFFYRNEKFPPIPAWMILRKIKSDYDLVYIRFWQGLLGFETVKKISLKLNCKIVFGCVDYSPMTGGCHFVADCDRYVSGCGCCPAFDSNDPNDFTHKNVLIREQIYKIVKPVVTGNSYMFSFFNKSHLLKNITKKIVYPAIDTELFSPKDVKIGLSKYNIPLNKKHILLFGSQQVNNERKGIKYLVEALNILYNKLSKEVRDQVIVVAIGNEFDQIKSSIKLDSIGLGYVSMKDLPYVYSFATLFLCSSINDAGPMMVNQSLCCGTPVVGFEMGACLDAVKGKGTGYCARLKDSNDFAYGIIKHIQMSSKEYDDISIRCREFALDTYSYKAFAVSILSLFNQRS